MSSSADADGGDGVPSSFSSPAEELSFWKERAQTLEKTAQEAQDELEEFQEGSRELEAELEAQLEQAEARYKEYRSLANRLQMDNEQIQSKLDQCQREYHCQVTDLQTELSGIKVIRDQLHKYVRDLEQQNDDLERAKRSTIASLEDFESRLNTAIERNAFLESELDEKEALKAAVQRMKDETKDLKSELRILGPRQQSIEQQHQSLEQQQSLEREREREREQQQRHRQQQQPDNDKRAQAETNNNHDSNKLAADCAGKSFDSADVDGADGASILNMTPPSSSKSSPSNRKTSMENGASSSQPLTPSARISALNIVGDLLRKVGALELKLVSCRNIVKEGPSATTATTTMDDSGVGPGSASPSSSLIDRSKRIPRGASTPSIKKAVNSAT